jgi:hypothetical protein
MLFILYIIFINKNANRTNIICINVIQINSLSTEKINWSNSDIISDQAVLWVSQNFQTFYTFEFTIFFQIQARLGEWKTKHHYQNWNLINEQS